MNNTQAEILAHLEQALALARTLTNTPAEALAGYSRMTAIEVIERLMRETGNGATHDNYDGYCVLFHAWCYLRCGAA